MVVKVTVETSSSVLTTVNVVDVTAVAVTVKVVMSSAPGASMGNGLAAA